MRSVATFPGEECPALPLRLTVGTGKPCSNQRWRRCGQCTGVRQGRPFALDSVALREASGVVKSAAVRSPLRVRLLSLEQTAKSVVQQVCHDQHNPADGSGAGEDREHDRVHRAFQACPPGTSIWCQFVKVAEMRTSDASAKATAMGSISNPLSPRAGNAAPGLGAPQDRGLRALRSAGKRRLAGPVVLLDDPQPLGLAEWRVDLQREWACVVHATEQLEHLWSW